MPTRAKRFGAKPASERPAAPSRGSARQRGYNDEWEKFRAWFATVVIPICGHGLDGVDKQFSCGKSFPSKNMHLDHLEKFSSLDDPLRLDENNVRWRCVSCHSKKTNALDNGGWQNT